MYDVYYMCHMLRIIRKAKAVVIRGVLNHGLKAIQPKSGNAQALLDLAKMAEKIPTKGRVPKDFSKNLDYYTWGGGKRYGCN